MGLLNTLPSSSLESITIGCSVSSIGQYAFAGSICSSVNIKDLSAWCKILFGGDGFHTNPLRGARLYLNNQEVTELIIPKDITKINSYAFDGCKSIEKVIIHNDVNSIGYSAFRSCSSITSVTAGSSVVSIGGYAFYDCPISEYYCYSQTPLSIGEYSYIFKGLEEEATLYVPARCGPSYKNSDWGDYFTNIIEMD